MTPWLNWAPLAGEWHCEHWWVVDRADLDLNVVEIVKGLVPVSVAVSRSR